MRPAGFLVLSGHYTSDLGHGARRIGGVGANGLPQHDHAHAGPVKDPPTWSARLPGFDHGRQESRSLHRTIGGDDALSVYGPRHF